MTNLPPQTIANIDVILDLRESSFQFDEREKPFIQLIRFWNVIAKDLIGKTIIPGQRLVVNSQKGPFSLLILDTHGTSVISETVKINVVDVERNPEIRHACKECKKNNKITFGPFFCPVCREQKTADRLCEAHSHFLENKFTAYCMDHVPHCQCRENCPEIASFECDSCHRTFSDRWKKYDPNDPLTILCQTCYAFKFELCEDCKKEGKKRLGRVRCAFPIGNNDERHNKRICAIDHAHFWQIWGPHWQGIILCEEHFQRLRFASITELLWMMVSARAPSFTLRSKVTDISRLRNMISYIRKTECSWADMQKAIDILSRKAIDLKSSKYVQENLNRLMEGVTQAQNDFPQKEAQFMQAICNFYRPYLRSDPASIILSVSIKRAFGGRDRPQSYRISVKVGKDSYGRSMKGILIGKGGALINQLKQALSNYGVDNVDLEE